MKNIDLMLDLETLDNAASPAIIQIAAKPFSLEKGVPLDGYFDKIINLKSAMDIGLTVKPVTLNWWLSQDKKVIDQVLVKSIQSENMIKDVLADLNKYVWYLKKEHGAEVNVWGNGNDYAWIASAYQAAGMEFAVKYWNSNDVRTLQNYSKRVFNIDFKKTVEFKGEKHNAIDDCLFQIKYLCEIHKHLNR